MNPRPNHPLLPLLIALGMSSPSLAAPPIKKAADCADGFAQLAQADLRALKVGQNFLGDVRLPDGNIVHLEFWKGADDKPATVIFNGFLYDFQSWHPTMTSVREKNGASVLIYNFTGQDKTAAAMHRAGKPTFPAEGISPELYAKELDSILKTVGIQGQIDGVALSYGSFISAAVAPEKFRSLTFVAPMVRPAAEAKPELAAANAMYQMMKLNPFTAGLADSQYRSSVRTQIEAFKPKIPEGIPEEKFIDGLVEQVLALRGFDLRKVDFSRISELHLILGEKEVPYLANDQKALWDALPEKSKKSVLLVQGSEHEVPSYAPAPVAAYLTAISGRSLNGAAPRGFLRSNLDGSEIHPVATFKELFP